MTLGGDNLVQSGVLDQRRADAIEALLEGRNVTEAALAAGVSRNSLHRWLRDPAFTSALRTARRERFATVEAVFPALATRAARCLLRELEEPGSIPSATIQAARIGLDAWRRSVEADILERVEELERGLRGDEGGEAK